MVIYLPGDQREPQPAPEPSFDELTPREIVVELDKYIVGQAAAKRAVAVALRNRVRRQKLPPEMAEECTSQEHSDDRPDRSRQDGKSRGASQAGRMPVREGGSFEIHEVGYVGRDVESMCARSGGDVHRPWYVRKNSTRVANARTSRGRARLDLLLLGLASNSREPVPRLRSKPNLIGGSADRTREKLRVQLRDGKLDHRLVEVEVRERSVPAFEIISNQGVEERTSTSRICSRGCWAAEKTTKDTVAEAFDYLIQEEENKLIDMDQVTRLAVERAEQMGIISSMRLTRSPGASPAMARMFRAKALQRDTADRRRHHGKHPLRHDPHRSVLLSPRGPSTSRSLRI